MITGIVAEIYLIGTIHNDLNGPRRLRNALYAEQPAILTLEATQIFIDNEEKRVPNLVTDTLIRNKAAEQIISYFREKESISSYEYKISKEYAQEKGIPLHLIDDAESDIHRSKEGAAINLEEKIKELEGVIPILNILPIIVETLRNEDLSRTNNLYKMVKIALGNKYEKIFSHGFLEPGRHVFGKRDETMAKRLKELAAENKDAKIVHVGGLAHLLDDEKGETLYSRLKEELNPIRNALIDYDFEEVFPEL